MKHYTFLLITSMLILQSCNEKKYQVVEKHLPDPKPLYGIKLGMSAEKYKQNLFENYKKGCANYDWMNISHENNDTTFMNDVLDLYLHIDSISSNHARWRLKHNFFNNRLMEINLSGSAIPKDSISSFIKHIDQYFEIYLEKTKGTSTNSYTYSSSSKKICGVIFENYKTVLYLADESIYQRIQHLRLFNANTIIISDGMDYWETYHRNTFNNYLQEEIIDVIYLDQCFEKRNLLNRIDFRFN